MDSPKDSDPKSGEMSTSEVLGEQGNVLPKRAMMRHRRRRLLIGNEGTAAVANNGSAANAASVNQLGIDNTSNINQTNNVTNIEI